MSDRARHQGGIVRWFEDWIRPTMLRHFVPRLRDRSLAVSEVRSALTGRLVDSHTNIVTVRLFSRTEDEDAFVRDVLDGHTAAMHALNRMVTFMLSTRSC